MSFYPNPPASFPKPGTTEFHDVFGGYIMDLIHGLHAEHTQSQVEETMAMVLSAKIYIGVPHEGVGHLMVGGSQNLRVLMGHSLYEMCNAHMKSDGASMNVPTFMEYCAKYAAEAAAHATKIFEAMQDGTGRAEVLHDAGRIAGDDGGINE